MTWHLLKCWPEYFDALLSGTKKCDARINDRDYKLGDVLVLQEWGPIRADLSQVKDYTGRVAIYRVTHCVYTHDLPLPRDKAITPIDWAVMSVEPWNENEAVAHHRHISNTPFEPGCL